MASGERVKVLVRENYTSIKSIVEVIVLNIARKYCVCATRRELEEELSSYAWYLVIEALQAFDEEKGASVVTYLWDRLWGRVERYANRYVKLRGMSALDSVGERELVQEDRDESWKDTLTVNPWRSDPDTVLECKERCRRARELFAAFGEEIASILSPVPEGHVMSGAERQIRSRKRQEYVSEFSAFAEEIPTMVWRSVSSNFEAIKIERGQRVHPRWLGGVEDEYIIVEPKAESEVETAPRPRGRPRKAEVKRVRRSRKGKKAKGDGGVKND